jgi:hypothetical protein
LIKLGNHEARSVAAQAKRLAAAWDWTIVVQREEPTIKLPDGKEILL